MRVKLATRISAGVVGVVVLASASSLVALFSSWQTAGLLRATVDQNVASVRAAEELEISLLEQRGYVTSYFLDRGDPMWLEELRQKKQGFDTWLARAQQTAHTSEEQQILAQLEQVYRAYDTEREQVVSLYDEGDLELARTMLLDEVNALFRQAYDLCEDFISANDQYVDDRADRADRQVQRTTWMVGTLVALTFTLGGGVLWTFFFGVLRPLREMVSEAQTATHSVPQGGNGLPTDELLAVGLYLHALVDDVTDTRSTLESSRSRLTSAEKLASVGKLAASVAHEMRSPLTAMKMWLYSIGKAVEADPELNQKCEIMSEEIRRLEDIVRNFLEFSRPPQLDLGRRQVSEFLDRSLELFRPHIERKGIRLACTQATKLSSVMADAEQLRQVFGNLLDNAADATPKGGEIRVTASAEVAAGRPMVVLRVQDDGPGMPEEVQQRVFEPFFSTKDDGTGLGLCIAVSIMARHNGRLVLESSTDRGTRFAMWIPVAASEEEDDEQGVA